MFYFLVLCVHNIHMICIFALRPKYLRLFVPEIPRNLINHQMMIPTFSGRVKALETSYFYGFECGSHSINVFFYRLITGISGHSCRVYDSMVCFRDIRGNRIMAYNGIYNQRSCKVGNLTTLVVSHVDVPFLRGRYFKALGACSHWIKGFYRKSLVFFSRNLL